MKFYRKPETQLEAASRIISVVFYTTYIIYHLFFRVQVHSLISVGFVMFLLLSPVLLNTAAYADKIYQKRGLAYALAKTSIRVAVSVIFAVLIILALLVSTLWYTKTFP